VLPVMSVTRAHVRQRCLSDPHALLNTSFSP
jgi:hypothetical protein